MPRRAALKSNRWIKVLAWTLGSLVVVVGIGLLAGQAWLNSYLRSPKFRAMLEEKSGQSLRAKVEIAPVRFEGTQFFCDTLRANGATDAGFSGAKVEGVRGEIALPSIIGVLFGDRQFKVQNVQVEKFTLEFYRDRLDLDLPPRIKRSGQQTDVGNLTVRDACVAWPGGGIKGATANVSAAEGSWKIEGRGGRVTQLGLPPIDLDLLRVVFREPSLFIQEARLRHDGGELTASGEVKKKEQAEVLFNFRNINVTPLLPDDWRARLHGRLGGEAQLKLQLRDPANPSPVVTGKLRLENAVLEALPILNEIAEYVKTDQFRRVEFQQATADVRYDAQALRVENLVLESKQLLVFRGGFTVANGMVDGTFDIGVTPGPLQYLPGSREKVFNVQRDGYAWTQMRVTGPVSAPKEDLRSRLIAAGKEAVVEKVESTATQAVDTTVDTVKKAATEGLNLLFGK